MLGLMQSYPLMISGLLTRAARHHGRTEIVSVEADGSLFRTNYADSERRARRLARALLAHGIGPHDRVGTLAWNTWRHFDLYYAVSGMQAVMHTVNPRLHEDDIAYIIGHAQDQMLFADAMFAPMIASIAPRLASHLRAVVFMTDRAGMPECTLPDGMASLCYDELLAASDENYVWPVFDENTASSLCYTSGTTGRPKGVLYSHRSTILHALGVNMTDAMALRAVDRVMPVVPMFHVNAWGLPYAALVTGATLVLPGRHLDGASLERLMNAERVTVSLGVPTVWLGLLQHLRATGARLPTVNRIITGGSACPPMLMEAFERDYGVRIIHAWGMTEISPVGTFSEPTAAQADLDADVSRIARLRQGRVLPLLDMKITDDSGAELPWDGVRFGDVKMRGPWVTSAYYGDAPGSACDAEGWFSTGDVGTIDQHGSMAITDRSKDVIKSGGEWISSITLENIAVSHPDVIEAAVIASRHPKWDERPLLLIVVRDGATVTRDDLLPLYEGTVPRWWLPDAVVTVEQLPHTATGKLLKTALRSSFAEYYMTADRGGA
jgi:acyl-CoA synthetase (AMP-forming)/AMP-acid ligase II